MQNDLNKSFSILTLGCAKNEVDSDVMRTRLVTAGLSEVEDVVDADIVIINTCAFLQVATQQSIELILDVAQSQQDASIEAPIVVCGCMPSRYKDDLKELLPEVENFVGCADEDSIVSVVYNALGIDETPVLLEQSKARTIESSSAYVMISDGCNRFCSFCAIPYIRGRYHSRCETQILEEVKMLMEGGVKEIVLIGQDTGIWGCDMDDPTKNLAWLLRQVAEVVAPYDGWVRVLYLQPEGMTDDLISTIRDTKEILNYIDIPIQHCNSEVLTRMRRKGSVEEYTELFARLRKEIPGMTLRSTALVAFPGETEEQFDELYEFVKETEFDYCSCFAYSQEDGTLAAKLDGQLDEDTKLEREQTMRDLCEMSGFAATAAHVGEVCDVIIDGVEETDHGLELIGHTWFQAPDSDGAVHIASGDVVVGDKVKCKLVDSFCYELVGEII